MLSKIFTSAIIGLEGKLVTVETDLTRGLPAYNVVGLGDKIIKESGERIRSAIINSGLFYPQERITVNLSPANIQKHGSHFDLPIAIGILLAKKKDLFHSLEDKVAFLGELSLDGNIKGIQGALPLALSAKEAGITKIIAPVDNAEEISLIKDIDVFPVSTLIQTVDFLNGQKCIRKYIYKGRNLISQKYSVDFSEVQGQGFAKRGMMIAAAGNHNVIMIGSPGVGKTMMAKRMKTILPSLSYEEMIEVTKIYSVAGLLSKENPMIQSRPFRAPHNTITSAALLGGGLLPKPGEVTLAHRGILFLDEINQFESKIINQLRQPIEEGKITISRQLNNVTFPANCTVVVAANPCRCGYYGDETHQCICTAGEINSHRAKLSGPLVDRLDLHIKMTRAVYSDMEKKDNLSSMVMREIVVKARKIQEDRYINEEIKTNGELEGKLIRKYCKISDEVKSIMKMAYERFNLSSRSYYKIIKIARTIADIEGALEIRKEDVLEALQYRSLEDYYRKK
ncbi:MAG: YifB family Mg chelatase-like AAA ATPase [Anaerovoracaceae bacterium]